MSYVIKLKRSRSLADRTLGCLTIGGQSFATLELPWRDNAPEISCIPAGRYKCSREIHGKYGRILRLRNVAGRSGILVHAGNYPRDTRGCILLGEGHSDIDGDGLPEVVNSRSAMARMCELLWGDEPLIMEVEDVQG